MSSLPPDQDEPAWYKCRHCDDQFKREDHLRRHELSHGFPRFLTASQSPPHDLHQLAAQGDSFNLTTEWDYAIHEWPEFGLHPGLPNFVQPSWQNCLMPVFDTTSSPLIPPSLALAHAPNASFPLDAAFVPHPALPLSPQDMRICVDKFRQRFLPRIPFLHYLTCEHECVSQNSALYYTMAMAGSLYLDNYRPKAARMHKLASETLQKQSRMANPSLQDFQANILIIDFAVWYGNEEMRRWASREKHALAQALIEFVSTSLPPLSYDDWGRWRLREEIKRTGFAFFVNCVMQSTFYGHDTPILASAIELSLPSPESIWEATSEAEWQTQVELLGLREKSEIIFPVAAHAILSQDTEYSTDYELATLFGQFILLCVIMDSYNAAAKLPTNYLTVEGWQNRDMALFRLRDTIDGALSLWTELWWASPECLWDANVPAHPRIENIFLHLYITTKLHKNEDSSRDRPAWTFKPIECATSMFTSVSKAGFTEVATYAAHILSFSCYYVAVEMSRTMSAWLRMVAAPSYGPLTRRDTEIVTRLRQAVRRHVAHPPTAPVTKQENLLGAAPVSTTKLLRDGSSLEDLIKQVEEIWTLGLGGEQWREDEVKGVAVRPLQSTPMPNLETPMPIP
ncbi:hypothetical protein SLS55_004072 [Diplodia seriata]|uniref:C2H2-type domain-containing protein n=1 Tax=Diplodia seriata TaxID=420778 RepID=A0ABR3CJG8_9PEZI